MAFKLQSINIIIHRLIFKKIKMSSVVLNSENNLSQCKKNLNTESDKVSDDNLFSSLFVIISDNNEESSLLDREIYLLVEKIK